MAAHLLPRLYQQEVFEHAMSRNTIVRMDTGTGKTLVAIMLIRHITSLPPLPGPSKLVVFVVPTIQLVHQQAAVVEKETSLKVKSFSGDMAVDYWKREAWISELEQCDVVICTAQIWLNVLSNAYWTIDRISLLIFDEAHHASKKHPYSMIMQDHYHRIRAFHPNLALPRILGMTASPIYNAKDPGKSIEELEKNLASRLVEATVHAEAINLAANKPIERLVEFEAPLDFSYTTEVETTLAKFISEGNLPFLKKDWDKINQIKMSLGTFASDAYICYGVEQLLSGGTTFGEAGNASPSTVDSSSPDISLLTLQASLLSLHSTNTINEDTITYQVQALIDELKVWEEKAVRGEFRAIVFTQRRNHAIVLKEVLERCSELEWLKPAWLVGHGGLKGSKGIGQDGGMKSKAQADTVKGFRAGIYNLLVATNIAEEGLDFQACNLVVRFDPMQTITGYIQSRGRARAAKSEFIVMAERDSVDARRYQNYALMEPSLKSLYGSRPTSDPDEPDLPDLPHYIVESTGAILTHGTAIPLLSEFCALLSTDPYTPHLTPRYSIEGTTPFMQGSVEMPMTSYLPGRKTFTGQLLSNKKAAKQSAAFGVCIELHEAGGLDDYLLPVRGTRDMDGKDADGNTVDVTPTKRSVDVVTKNFFGDFRLAGSTIYLNIVEIEDGQDVYEVGLICADSLDLFKLGEIFESNPARPLKVRRGAISVIAWTNEGEREERMRQLEEFNLHCVWAVINHRLKKEESFYALWAPLDPLTRRIDWEQIERAFLPAIPDNLTPGATVVFPCRRSAHHIFTYIETRTDVTSLSPTAEIVRNPSPPMEKLVKKYNRFFIYVKIVHNYQDMSEDKPEPILELESLPEQCRNLLLPNEYVPQEVKRKSICATQCRVSTLPLAFWNCFRRTPSVLRVIHDEISTKTLLRELDLPSIDLRQLTVALTSPSACVGFDYQYLETLGDSALKIATTIHIYLENPTFDEERLHTVRRLSVDNRFLNKKSVSIGLAPFILSQYFRTSTWIPPTSDKHTFMVEGSIHRTINRRALQDTMEATLGAAFLTGGMTMVLEAGQKMGLCFGGTMPWGERASALRLVRPETGTSPGLKKIEESLGYKFKNGNLLLQAFTHRSYSAGTTHCYEREEHLGDAVIDYWATIRLVAKFPNSTPGILTYLRTVLVSNPALALVAIKRLDIQRNVLHSSSALDKAMRAAVDQAASLGWSDMLDSLTWLWDPPKVLGDVLEAIIGSIFVDVEFQLEPVLKILDRLYEDVILLMKDEEQKDPISTLTHFKQVIRCKKILLKTTYCGPSPTSQFSSTVTFHSTPIATSVRTSKNVAKQQVSREAYAYFQSMQGSTILQECSCVKEEEEAKEKELRAEEEGARSKERALKEEERGRKHVLSDEEAQTDENEEDEDEDEDEDEEMKGHSHQRVRIY